MTTIYDPHHPLYLDEADTRKELERVFGACHGCGKCVNLCSSFPTLFDYINDHDDRDAGNMTPAQQDQVIEECYQCKLCYVECPYIPGQHELSIDFPRLMLRADAMRRANGQMPIRSKFTTSILGHADMLGKVGTSFSVVTNVVMGAKPGSVLRKAMQVATGISSVRVLPPFAKLRFSTWFKRRPRVRLNNPTARVSLFPTCVVEYQNPAIGQDLVKVFEHNGIECSVAGASICCGAPFLHSGDLSSFVKVAAKNVASLVEEVRKGNDIVVPQPTCSYILKKDYVDYVGGPDAILVAQHTFDACEFLMKMHKADTQSLELDFKGNIPEVITYHAPCHLRAQNIGLKSRDLLKLTGAKVRLIQQCSGIDGMWGFRAENMEQANAIAEKLGHLIQESESDVVVGDCHLANTVIFEQTQFAPMHPLQILARAYGIPEEN